MLTLQKHIVSRKHKLLIGILLLLSGVSAVAQPEEVASDTTSKLVDAITISGSMQFWMRYTTLNPGSTIQGREEADLFDVSIRRFRLKFSGKPSANLRYTVEFGNNDLNSYNYSEQWPRLLEASVDYEINPYIAIGLGKQGWTGLSRYAAPSTTQAVAYDPDFIAAPFVNVYDDILRRIGIYARGSLRGLDYRAALAKPAVGKGNDYSIGEDALISNRSGGYQFSTYIKYQFLERESQSSAFSPGTYLGKKNLLNIGIGTLHQPDATWSVQTGDTVYHRAKSVAVDLFFEKRLPASRGVTLYLAYIRHDLGRNFMRYMGANNPATGSNSTEFLNGKGNNTPVIGTGRIYYAQAAFIRPLDHQNKTQLQPYASLAYNRFDALGIPVMTYNAGFNCYLNGQRSKLTVGFQSRPVLKQKEPRIDEAMRKEMLVVQYQILFGE